MNRRATILVNDQPAGTLEETDVGYRFSYLPGWLVKADAEPVSLTLPLSDTPFESKTFFPFFDGLIPEGWLLDITVKNWKLDPRDRMGLLLSVCRDCIGSVSVITEES